MIDKKYIIMMIVCCCSLFLLSGCQQGAIVNGYTVLNQTKQAAGTFNSIPFTSTAGLGNPWGQYNTPYDYKTTGSTYNFTQTLQLSNFGFNIPTNAIITGISFSTHRVVPSSFAIGHDNNIYLVSAGNIIGNNMKSSLSFNNGGLATNVSPETYGGYNNKWGATLTPAIVNDPTFGVRVDFISNIPIFTYLMDFSTKGGFIVYYYVPTTSNQICTIGDRRCPQLATATYIEICNNNASGGTYWQTMACGGNLICTGAGQCTAPAVVCTNDCPTSNLRQCSGISGYQICGNYDTDTCLEWGTTVTACAAGTICSSGNCISTCTPTTCVIQNKNCGNISNGCSGTLNCGVCTGAGYTCTNNVCTAPVITCTNDCPTSGLRECVGTAGYHKCGYIDSDTCLEWNTTTISCPTGTACGYGANCLAVNTTQACTVAGCNDNNACTTDSCVNNACAHTAIGGCGVPPPVVCKAYEDLVVSASIVDASSASCSISIIKLFNSRGFNAFYTDHPNIFWIVIGFISIIIIILSIWYVNSGKKRRK